MSSACGRIEFDTRRSSSSKDQTLCQCGFVDLRLRSTSGAWDPKRGSGDEHHMVLGQTNNKFCRRYVSWHRCNGICSSAARRQLHPPIGRDTCRPGLARCWCNKQHARYTGTYACHHMSPWQHGKRDHQVQPTSLVTPSSKGSGAIFPLTHETYTTIQNMHYIAPRTTTYG